MIAKMSKSEYIFRDLIPILKYDTEGVKAIEVLPNHLDINFSTIITSKYSFSFEKSIEHTVTLSVNEKLTNNKIINATNAYGICFRIEVEDRDVCGKVIDTLFTNNITGFYSLFQYSNTSNIHIILEIFDL